MYTEAKIPNSLSELNVPKEAIENLARSAVKVERLMKNNLREISVEDAIKIYNKAY